MPAPGGLSGAPLIEVGSKRVVGVVYGRHGVESIEELARVDPETKERIPEVLRIEHLALAVHTTVLKERSGTATGGKPLSQYVSDVLAPG